MDKEKGEKNKQAMMKAAGKPSESSTDIPQFEVTVTLRNNRIRERRLALGLTQHQVAVKLKTSDTTYGRFERAEIVDENTSCRKDVMKNAAKFFKCSVDDLLPDDIRDVVKNKLTCKLDKEDIVKLLSNFQAALITDPEVAIAREKIEVLMLYGKNAGVLTERQMMALTYRYGFDQERKIDQVQRSYEDVAKMMGVQVNTVIGHINIAIDRLKEHYIKKIGQVA